LVGLDGAINSHETIEPTGCFVARTGRPIDMGISREGVQHKNPIGAIGIQRAPRFEGDGHLWQVST
jgi:hypothetical protein